jgi:hypothetical protein
MALSLHFQLNQFRRGMYKQLTAAILLLAFMASTFCQAAIVANYYTNTAAYAKNCENKARPQMHCNGKCQMMKKLQQEEKQNEENPDRKAENKNEIISINSFPGLLCHITFISTSFLQITTINKPVDMSYTFFRPPAIV